MKNLLALVFVLLFTLSVTACGSNSSKDDILSQVSNKSTDKAKATEIILTLCNSDDPDEIKELVTDNDDEMIDRIIEAFPGDDYNVKLEKFGKYKDYIVYKYTLTRDSEPGRSVSGLEIFKKKNGKMYIANDVETINAFTEDCTCNNCNGTGTGTTVQNACGICGGTGVQYYPNSYYDSALNMWVGETRACSGCGGSGGHSTNSSACTNCDGVGFVLD